MKFHANAIMAIIKKDLHGLLPLVLLANIVFLVQPLIASLDILSIAGDVEFWAVAQANFYWLGYFLGVLLMISVVQQDPADSLNHDWLTRPIARLDWFLAKLMFLLLTVCVPVVVARFVVNLSEGYGMPLSLSYALAFEKMPAIMPVPLLFAAALWAPTLRKTIFLMVLVFLVFLLPAWSVTRPLLALAGIDLGAEFDGMMWLQSLPIIAAGVAGTLLVYWLLYCRRMRNPARLAFCAMVAAVFFTVYPPSWLYNWDRAIAIHQVIYNPADLGADDALSQGVVLEPVQACFPATFMNDGSTTRQDESLVMQAAWRNHYVEAAGVDALTFATTIKSRQILVEWISPSITERDLGVDWRIDRIRARAWLSGDALSNEIELERSSTATNRFAPISSVDTDYWLVPESALSALAENSATQLTLEYDLALLSPSSHELATDGKRRDLPGLGSCKAELNGNINAIQVECIKRGKRPALVSAELIGVENSRVDSHMQSSFVPDWAESFGRQRYQFTLNTPHLVDSSVILLTGYQIERILSRQLISPGLLGDSDDICPLPGDESALSLANSSWSDTSPHEVISIAVERGVRVEVLDWRTGNKPDAPTLFLLPGLGATAHSYDVIAQKLSDTYNVVAMTRRGTGASDKPSQGYDIARLSQDVLQVLDTLQIESAVLIGHSIAGEELSYLGANHPEHFRGLVYLDAAYDRVSRDPTFDHRRYQTLSAHLPSEPPMRPSEAASYAALIEYAKRSRGNGNVPPEGEILASYDLNTGMIRHNLLYLDAIMMGLQAPDYSRIAVPALGIYAVPGSPDALMKAWYDRDDPVIRETVAELYETGRQRLAGQMTRFDTEIPDSEVIGIIDADHWIFLSHEQQVLDAIRGFVGRIE